VQLWKKNGSHANLTFTIFGTALKDFVTSHKPVIGVYIEIIMLIKVKKW
jgi:hypothetical protein